MRYDESTLPERRLMQAVILTAIADACGSAVQGRRDFIIEADKRDAIRWLSEAGHDFQRVCELAGLHHETVRKFSLAFIRSGDAFPRVHRQNASRRGNPLSPSAIAARAGISASAVRGVLKHDQGSAAIKEMVRRSLRAIAEERPSAA